MNYKLVWWDTETTGLDVFNDNIIEIAAVCDDNEFNILLETNTPLPEFIVRFTGITDEMLEKDGVSQREGLEAFYKYLTSLNEIVILIAHNGDDFDKIILNSSYRRVIGDNAPYLSCFNIYHFDTKKMAKFLYPDLKSYSLKNLCKYFGIENPNHHRALNDAIVCQRLFEHMFQQSNYMDFRDLYKDIYTILIN